MSCRKSVYYNIMLDKKSKHLGTEIIKSTETSSINNLRLGEMHQLNWLVISLKNISTCPQLHRQTDILMKK